METYGIGDNIMEVSSNRGTPKSSKIGPIVLKPMVCGGVKKRP